VLDRSPLVAPSGRSCIHRSPPQSLGDVDVGKPEEPYIRVVVETYYESGSGLHGDIHVRPIAGEQPPRSLRVRFPKALRHAHPVGTRFLVYAKLTDKEGGNDFVHTNHAWDVEVLGLPDE
jgi:hypothetical protein